MRYTPQSVKYVAKNFLYLLPFAILPALLLCLSTDEDAILRTVKALFAGDIGEWHFVDLFRAISVLSFSNWQSIVFGIVGIIATVPCVALLMAFLDKHMRIGRRSLRGLWSKLNNNFVSTCGGVVLLLAIYEVWALLLSAFLFSVSRISLLPVAYAACICIFLAFHLVLPVAISAIYLWMPCMQMTGFRTMEAWQYSYQLMGEIKWKIICAQMLALLVVESAICAIAWFVPTYVAFDVLVTVLYAVLLLIFCVRMQIVYFDRDHIERADIRKYY